MAATDDSDVVVHRSPSVQGYGGRVVTSPVGTPKDRPETGIAGGSGTVKGPGRWPDYGSEGNGRGCMSVAMGLCGTVVGGTGADIGVGAAEDVGVRGRERCGGSRVDAEDGIRADGVSGYSSEWVCGCGHVRVGMVRMVARLDVRVLVDDVRVDVLAARVGTHGAVRHAGGAAVRRTSGTAVRHAGGGGGGAAAAAAAGHRADDRGDVRVAVRGR